MKMTNLISTNQSKKVEDMVLQISQNSPTLNDLTQEQLEQVARIVITQNLTNELNLKSKLVNINYKMERDIFLLQVSRTGSVSTQSSYFKSLKLLEKYTKKNGLNILQLTPGQVDDFFYTLDGSPNTKNLIISGISSFYSYMERRHSVIKNPVRGTKSRPVKKPVRELEIPDEMEVFTILNELPELEKMMVYIMSYRGLRVGSLNKLKVWGNKYQSYSKGKMIHGEFPVEVITNIKCSDIYQRSPFEGYSTNSLKLRLYRQTMKLYKEGKIRSPYSSHDFRHYFSVTEYQKDKDIYRLSKLLDHSNISITEGYLRSLRVDI
jgi:site-specific recombinase XerD